MEEKEILARLQTIVNETLGREDLILKKRTKLKTDLDVNSFALVQLICAVEDAFDLSIPNTEIRGFKTVGALMHYIKKEQRS